MVSKKHCLIMQYFIHTISRKRDIYIHTQNSYIVELYKITLKPCNKIVQKANLLSTFNIVEDHQLEIILLFTRIIIALQVV